MMDSEDFLRDIDEPRHIDAIDREILYQEAEERGRRGDDAEEAAVAADVNLDAEAAWTTNPFHFSPRQVQPCNRE